MRKLVLALTLLTAAAPYVSAQSNPSWTTPIAPFQIADNLYYVGSQDLASFLITTPQGDILINTGTPANAPLIRHSIEQLGFKLTDVRILLNGQAHSDHVGGNPEILRQTHAKQMVMDADVPAIEQGGKRDFRDDTYNATHVDRILHDNDTVTLGNVTLTAHKTAGHTRGCTTWTFRTTQHGKPENVVIVGGLNPLDYRLVAKPGHPLQWPSINTDFTHTFATMKTFPCDIFLGAHGVYFNMLAKLHARNSPQDESVWIDPAGYEKLLASAEDDYRKQLAKQQAE